MTDTIMKVTWAAIGMGCLCAGAFGFLESTVSVFKSGTYMLDRLIVYSALTGLGTSLIWLVFVAK